MKASILIKGVIGGEEGFNEKTFSESIPNGCTELDVYIDSIGGYAITAWKIYYFLELLQVECGMVVRTYALANCKSAATIIHLAAPYENRFVTEETEYMIHEAWTEKGGNARELREKADAMEVSTNQIKGLYLNETTLDVGEVDEMLAAETTLTPEQCVHWCFAIEVLPNITAGVVDEDSYLLFRGYVDTVVATVHEAEWGLVASIEQNPKILKALSTSLGYKRSEMPQIDPQYEKHFLDYLTAKYGEGIITRGEAPIKSFKPSQRELNWLKVFEKLGSDHWRQREYMLSKDGYLLDGHHDWAAGVSKIADTPVKFIKIGIPARKLIEEANSLKITYNSKL